MRKALMLSAMLVLCAILAFAQSKEITGKVIDASGSPISGATIKIKGTNTGTSADMNGEFHITIGAKKVLVISSVGYESQEITIGSQSTVNVRLTQESKSLSEVVVTGLGVATSKKKVPIDVASLSAKDFPKSATTSVEQALVGQIAGAQIQQTTGQPGNSALIILRGLTNLDGSGPLILMDGIQTSSDILMNLDPSEIERIEVVKGSAGGMLYGSQGGNGVIQVFTKKGAKNSKMNITFSSKVSIDKVLRGKRPLQAAFHHYDTDASGNILDAGGNPIAHDANGVWVDPSEMNYTVDPTVVNNKPFNLPTFDHISQSFRTATTYANSINITGGNTNSDYAVTIARLDQQSIFGNKYNRTNLGINLGFNPVQGLTFRTNTNIFYTYEDLLGGNRFNMVNSYQWLDFKFKDTTGHYTVKPSDNIDGNNTLSERDWHQRNSKTFRIIQSANVNYKFPKFVELDYKYSVDFSNRDDYNYYLNQSSTPYAEYWSNGNAATKNGSIQDSYDKFITQYSNASLYFRTDFQNDFKLNVPIKTTTQVSYDWRREDDRSYWALGAGLPPYPPANITGATTLSAHDNTTAFVMYGFLVNQTIDFGNLFGVSGGFRSDYSSEFGAGSKAFTFPRGTAYFRPSELFGNHNLLADWKIRGAYGEAGVQPGRYARQVTLDNGPLGQGGTVLVLPGTAHNPNLNVQVTKELEIGTDATFTPTKGEWLNRITLNGSYWKRNSDNVIQTASVALSTGYGGLQSNLVSLTSHGVDLNLDASIYSTKNFTWDMGIRWGYSKTLVSKISNNLDVIVGNFALKEGKELGVMYGQTQVKSLTQLKADGKTPYIAPGNEQYYEVVNGGVVDKRTNTPLLTASNDLSQIGKAYPDFTSSITNRFTLYRNLSFSFQFDWVHGNNIYNITRQWLYRDKLSKDFDQPVTINGKTGAFVAYYEGFYNTLSPDSWFVEDGSFVRLRDASVSYDLTPAVNRKWLRSLVLTVSGRNLATFTKYHGLDPENTTAVNNQGVATGNMGAFKGVDYFGIPNVKSYQVSLNIGF